MIDRMRPTSPDDPFKKGKAEELDDEKRRIEKAREVDPEEKKKFRKYIKQEEEKQEKTKSHTPYDSKFHKNSFDETTAKENQKIDQVNQQVPLEEKGPDNSSHQMRSDQEQTKNTQAEKIEPKHPKKEAKEVKTTVYLPPKPNERVEQKNFEKTPKEKTENPVEEEIDQKEIKPIAMPAELPLDIAQRASEITRDLTVYLNPEIVPLFEQMVGQMVIMSTQEGIMQTEVELTSDLFQGSVFYGSKITLEKYATAPDSFNIQLTGSPEAVAIFNGNLASLMESFRSDLNFRIGKIEAAHETTRPLFRRKEPPTNEGGGKSLR